MAQCEQTGRSNPQMPAGFDITGTCGCAYDRALAGKPNPEAIMTNPQTSQAVSEAIASCARERMGAAGAAPSGGAEEAEEEAAEEGAEEK
jgi:ribosomal protein L12E/L44/L45/RPP1/RPP2